VEEAILLNQPPPWALGMGQSIHVREKWTTGATADSKLQNIFRKRNTSINVGKILIIHTYKWVCVVLLLPI
jgi:hypothetical protein